MKLEKTKIRLFISVLIFSWLFFGWPQIGFDTLATSFNFPPGLQDAYASHNYEQIHVRGGNDDGEPQVHTWKPVQAYPADIPTIQNVTGQNYSSISSFAETLGAGNQGLIKYELSNDGTTWCSHNGSLWVTATPGFVHANTAAEVELDQIEINAAAVTKGQPSGKKSAGDTAVGASFEEVTVP